MFFQPESDKDFSTYLDSSPLDLYATNTLNTYNTYCDQNPDNELCNKLNRPISFSDQYYRDMRLLKNACTTFSDQKIKEAIDNCPKCTECKECAKCEKCEKCAVVKYPRNDGSYIRVLWTIITFFFIVLAYFGYKLYLDFPNFRRS